MAKFAKVAAIAMLIIGANIAYVSLKTQTTPPPPFDIVQYGDHLLYLEVARAPFTNDVRSPFCWRLLSPLIVHVFADVEDPSSLDLAYYLLNAICLISCLIIFFYYLEGLGYSFGEGVLGIFLLGSLPGFGRWYFYQSAMTDPPVLLIVALSFLFIQRRWYLPLSVALTIGVIGREVTVLMLPYLFLRLLREQGLVRAGRTVAGVAVIPIAMLVFIRFGLAPGEPITHLNWDTLRRFAEGRQSWDFLYFATLGTWGMVSVLLAIDARSHLRKLFRTNPEQGMFVATVFAQLLVANNVDRLLVYAYPVLIPLALTTMRRVQETMSRPRLCVLALVCLQLFWYQSVVLWNSAINQPFNSTQVVLFFALCTGLVLSGIGSRPQDDDGDSVPIGGEDTVSARSTKRSDGDADRLTMPESWKKAVFFSLLPLLLLAAGLEVGARALELWKPPRAVDPGLGFDDRTRVFVPSPDDPALLVTESAKSASFRVQQFSRNKSDGVYRIFLLGGSNVHHLHEKLPALSKALERETQENTRVEIINVGGLAYGSGRLVPVANEIVDYDPDLVVIYAGHNEFEELEQLSLVDLRLLPVQRWLYRSAFARLLREWLVDTRVAAMRRENNRGILANPEVDYRPANRHRFGPDEIAERMRAYRSNLAWVLSELESHGVVRRGELIDSASDERHVLAHH